MHLKQYTKYTTNKQDHETTNYLLIGNVLEVPSVPQVWKAAISKMSAAGPLSLVNSRRTRLGRKNDNLKAPWKGLEDGSNESGAS
jgi:hypothetical protein